MFYKSILTALTLAALSSAAGADVIIKRGIGSDPSSLDQHQTSTVDESTLLAELYQGLLSVDARANLIPGVAASWTISEDGLTYHFQLRDNAKWSNGSPVVAEDFVYSLRRIMDPKTAAGYASILFPIKNAEAVAKGKLPVDELGVKALGDHELEIVLEKATPYFLEILTHQTALPLYRPSVEAHGDKFTSPDNMVTNGAYKLSRYVPNDVIVMRRNAHFWDAGNVRIDQINWMSFPDIASCMRRFEAKEVDICPSVAAEQMDYIRTKLSAEYRQSRSFSVFYLIVKGAEDSKLRDPRVREALSMIIDRKFLSEQIMRGTTFSAETFVPVGTANYVASPPQLEFASEDMLDREDKAKALLQEAGVTPGSLTVKLRFATSENNRNIMAAITDMFKRVDVQAISDEAEPASYFNLLQNKGEFDFSYAGWSGDYNDPNTFLGLFTTGNYFNYGSWSNSEFDALIAQATVTQDHNKRAELFASAEKILLKESAIIPVTSPTSRALVAQKVKGYEDNVRNQHRTRWLSLE